MAPKLEWVKNTSRISNDIFYKKNGRKRSYDSISGSGDPNPPESIGSDLMVYLWYAQKEPNEMGIPKVADA